MENILQLVEEALMKNEKYVSEDGKLVKATVYADVMNIKTELLTLLLENKKIKDTFFEEVDGVLVFDKQKFAWFVESKQFLPDSYTRYANKIGLTKEGKFISQRNDVVLDFPYKECVLQGGQEKDDEERQEIFYNEIIGSEHISRMLSPKIFSNSKRYTKDGVEENITFDVEDNLIVKGNNLIVLASLLKKYKGRVKCIYIDPPYNTGSDSFHYNDSFNHSTWLTFMKNRLELARKLLKEDGVIFVQCDDNEQAYLKVLMDDIFGRENFVNCIAVKMSEATGVKMSHAKTRFPKLKEYILFYKKSDKFQGFYTIDKYRNNEWDKENNMFLENLSESQRQVLQELEEKDVNDDNDVALAINTLKDVKIVSLSEKIKSLKSNVDVNDWLFDNSYRIIKTAGSASLLKQIKLLDTIPSQDISAGLSRDKVLFFYITKFNPDTAQPRLRVIFADRNIYKNPCDFWQDIKTSGAISKEGGVVLTNGKKPEKILKRIIAMTTKEDDIILDYHIGSGTTCAVAHKMGRRYIGIEQMNYIEDIVVERMNNVISGEQGGVSKEVEWKGGGSFVYCELLENAQSLISKIEDATEKNILDIKDIIFKDERIIPYISSIELDKLSDDEFDKLSLEDKKKILCKLVDKNKLYINLSDVDDESYSIRKEDIDFTNSFYNAKEI